MCVDLPETELVATFIAHRPHLHRLARSIVGNTEIADEVVQDAYLKLDELPGARDIVKPLCYCCQVVRNLALDFCRR